MRILRKHRDSGGHEPPEGDDADLLSRSAREPTAFEPLVERYSTALHGYLARRAPAAADDLLSEVWLRAFAGRSGFDPARGTVRGWLFGVARHVLAAHWRDAEVAGPPGPGPDEQHRLPGRPGGTAGCPELAALTAAREVAPPSATALADVRAVLRAAVEREEEAAVVPATRPRLRGPRRWIVTGAAVAAVATGLAVLPVVDFGGGGTAANASAAAFLDETAQHAATGVQHSGKYWRVFTARLIPGRAEVRDVMFVDREKARDRILNRDKGGAIMSWYSEYRGQWRWGTGRAVVTWDQLNQLPTGTAALRTRLTGTDFGETVRTITDLLATSPASPKLRAALYRVLATTPGIHLDGAARDSRGREGTSISVTYNEQFGSATARATDQLLIDPRTGVLLQEHLKILTHPKGSQGRVQQLSTTTYLSSGWVDKLS